MSLRSKAAKINEAGLKAFANGDPEQARNLLRKAYLLLPEEPGILVNLGLCFMQLGHTKLAEKAYQLVIEEKESSIKTKRSAYKNLGFLNLWLGRFEEGWHYHGLRFKGEPFVENQWRGDPLNGQELTIWNDVGMGDAFQFARYLKPLIERGEHIKLGVEASQIDLFKKNLCWPIAEVIDRRKIDHIAVNHIPLMSLIPLIDPKTTWGRSFNEPTFTTNKEIESETMTHGIGICWASNPNDKTMHIYKSISPEEIINQIKSATNNQDPKKLISLQTDEKEAHQRMGIKTSEKDWGETLHKIKMCSEVWSVDTAIVHLASGLGKPVQMILNNPPDWRWKTFSDREVELQQIWYPSLSIKSLDQRA